MKQENPPAMVLTTTSIPLWIIHFHKMIQDGNGDMYRERAGMVFTMITPTPAEEERFPYLKDVETIWLVYNQR